MGEESKLYFRKKENWFKELLYKIKTPKLRKNRVTRILSYFVEFVY